MKPNRQGRGFYRVIFASWILTSCDVYVLHAELLAVVGVGCAREGQQQHVDKGSVGLTCSGGDPRLVVVPNLITERGGLDASRKKWKGFYYFGRKGKILSINEL